VRPRREVTRILRRLAKVRPWPNYPIEVKWGNFRHFAEVDFCYKRNVFVISLSRKRITTWSELLDTLIHEKAHILTWHAVFLRSAHGPEWGVAFARLYRAYHRER